MEELGQGHFGLSVPVCSVPVPGIATGPVALFVPPAAAAAGLGDLLLQLPELDDWLGQPHGQHERHALHLTAAQLQPGAAPEPAAATTAAVLAIKLSTAEKTEEERIGEEMK